MSGQQSLSGCVDRAQRPVALVVDNALGWSGVATIENDRPVIYWNEHDMARASRSTQVFIYLHECAHHVLGHIWKPVSPRWEAEADCWAIQLMVEGGMVNGSQIDVIQRELRTSPGDANHLGGQDLMRSLAGCLDIKTDARAWAHALDRLEAASADSFRSVQGQNVPDPSATSGAYESDIDLPGTYDCEITPRRTVRCVIFAARKQQAVEARFRRIERILRDWFSPSWTAVTSAAGDAGIPGSLQAENSRSGAIIILAATNQRQIVFEFRSATEPVASEGR